MDVLLQGIPRVVFYIDNGLVDAEEHLQNKDAIEMWPFQTKLNTWGTALMRRVYTMHRLSYKQFSKLKCY